MVPIILQSRLGSTRLKHKMVLPFYSGDSLFAVIVKRLLTEFPNSEVILATTENPDDDILAELGLDLGITVFRGSENNVLSRFIKAADNIGAKALVRICADNPFILPEFVRVIQKGIEEGDTDYLSYSFPDNTPVIRSHVGLFGEAVKLSALKKVSSLSDDSFYKEHVTNYIYEHSDQFKCKFLDLPEVLKSRQDIRLTIDTMVDFETIKALYSSVNGSVSMDEIVNSIDANPGYKSQMANQIRLNSK